jgi:hypothetical protein
MPSLTPWWSGSCGAHRTCPASGQYSVLLRAHDEAVTAGQLQLIVAPALGGDPCLDVGGATLTQDEGVISFIGDGDYEADALVRWHLFSACPLATSRGVSSKPWRCLCSASGRSGAGMGSLTFLSSSAAWRLRRTTTKWLCSRGNEHPMQQNSVGCPATISHRLLWKRPGAQP